MVKGVEEVRTELEILRLAQLEILKERDIEVINRRQQERVASNVGFSPRARLDVTSIGIVDQISNDWSRTGERISVREEARRCQSAQRCDSTANAFRAIRIKYGTVASAVTIQIRVIAAAERDSLAGFVGVSARDAKTAEQCLG